MKKTAVKQALLCVLAAGLCAGLFAAAFAALPQCAMPLWLPCAAAFAGGGLCLCRVEEDGTPLFPGRLFVLLCVLTILVGLLLGAGNIEGRSPALFADWINSFFPY